MKEKMHKHKGIMMMIVGVVILTNELYLNLSWWIIFGVLLVLFGAKKTFMKCKEE